MESNVQDYKMDSPPTLVHGVSNLNYHLFKVNTYSSQLHKIIYMVLTLTPFLKENTKRLRLYLDLKMNLRKHKII